MSPTRSSAPTFAAEIPALPPAQLRGESWRTRLFTEIGIALDATVLRAMQLVVERALIPDSADIGALRASARTMLDPGLQAEPARFFAFLDEAAPPSRVRDRFVRRIPGGSVLRRRVESDYEPWSREVEGNGGPMLFEHWRHERERPRGTIVALHGFTMGRPRIDAIALFAGQWFRRGLDVALVTLPYHGARTPSSARFSGEHFAVPDVLRLSEAVREAVYEVRQLTRLIRGETGAPVGLIGLSLGGYLAALCAALCEDLDFAVPMVPPVCIGDLAWGFYERTRHHLEGGEATLSREELRRSFRVHSPLAHPLRLPKERVLIVAGRGDRIVPPEHPAALWSHWGEPAIHWFSGSHLAPFGRARIVRAIAGHLEALDVL